MGRTACTEPQSLYKGDLYFYFTFYLILRVGLCDNYFWYIYILMSNFKDIKSLKLLIEM